MTSIQPIEATSEDTTRTPTPLPPFPAATSSTSTAHSDHLRRRKDRIPTFAPDPRPWAERSNAYQLRPFRGMWDDVKRRAPFYMSDWTEGIIVPRNWERVIGGTVRMYFLNLMPALAYTLDMEYRTEGNYGVNQTVLASALAALVFSVLGVQPLTIVGVTGLINLFNYTTYDIVRDSGIDFLQFQAWVLIWSAITHWITAIFNICDYTRFITDMTSETFGLYVGVIYIQKGIELLVLEFDISGDAGWFSVVIAMLFALFVYFVERSGTLSFGPFWFRKGLIDYAFAAGIVFFTGFTHVPGNIKDSGIEFLPITKAFAPSTGRPWLIRFWELPVGWVFIAIPFGCLVTLLFYFDNNVSSVMSQARGFPVKRPAGFHFDFFLLGIVTFIAGILGLPAPNGLVPQAPVHTESLCVTKVVDEDAVLDEDGNWVVPDSEKRDYSRGAKVVRTRVVEQRVTHFAMGLLTLGTMTRPLLVVLGLMSRAMFAGIFIVVGWASVEGNGITHKTLYLLRDSRMTPRDHPLRDVRKSQIGKYVFVQWVFFAAIIAVSETIAGIGFPVIITILIPVRHYLIPRYFTSAELLALDAPTANSAAVLVSLGGPLPPAGSEGSDVPGYRARASAIERETVTTLGTESSGSQVGEESLRRRKGTGRREHLA